MKVNKKQRSSNFIAFFILATVFSSPLAILWIAKNDPASQPSTDADLVAFVQQSECHKQKVSTYLGGGLVMTGRRLSLIDAICARSLEKAEVAQSVNDETTKRQLAAIGGLQLTGAQKGQGENL